MKTGRPPIVFNALQRDEVRRLKAAGWTNQRVARYMQVSLETLENKCREELLHGADEKLAQVLKWAEETAKKKNATMIKWLAEKYTAEKAAARLTAPLDLQPKPEKKEKIGKQQERKEAAERVKGVFETPPPPKPPRLN